MKMNQININQKGEVKIIGEIISSQKYENFQVLKIQDSTGTIKGILNSNKNFSGNITIIGTIAEYNKEPEIEIHKIIFLS
jgi:aspartyl/asparaginyl-tRNA synthetase